MKYTVYVDDNYNYMDEESRYTLGEFDTWDAAVQKAREIVDEFLLGHFADSSGAEELLAGYKRYGEDPFIMGGDESQKFSAWEYAKKRCEELYKR